MSTGKGFEAQDGHTSCATWAERGGKSTVERKRREKRHMMCRSFSTPGCWKWAMEKCLKCDWRVTAAGLKGNWKGIEPWLKPITIIVSHGVNDAIPQGQVESCFVRRGNSWHTMWVWSTWGSKWLSDMINRKRYHTSLHPTSLLRISTRIHALASVVWSSFVDPYTELMSMLPLVMKTHTPHSTTITRDTWSKVPWILYLFSFLFFFVFILTHCIRAGGCRNTSLGCWFVFVSQP